MNDPIINAAAPPVRIQYQTAPVVQEKKKSAAVSETFSEEFWVAQ